MRDLPDRIRDTFLHGHETLPAWARPLTLPLRWVWVFYRALERDQAFIRAAGMAYSTLVALVPMLLFMFGVLDATGVLASNPEAIEAFIFRSFLGDIPEVRDTLLPGLLHVNLSTIGLIGIGGLFLVSMRLFALMETAYCDIFGVENHRQPLMRVLLFYTSITVAPVVLLATFLQTWDLAVGLGWSFGRDLAVVTLQFSILLAALKGLPATHVRWIPALAGATTSLVLMRVASWGFRTYLALFAAADPVSVIYGSLGVLPFFLLWLYLVWVVVLLGVEVAAVAQNYSSMVEAELAAAMAHLAPMRELELDAVLLVAAALARAYARGEGPIETAELGHRVGLTSREVSRILHPLEDAGIVACTEGGVLPARPPADVALREVVEAWRSLAAVHAEHISAVSRVRAELDRGVVGTLAGAAQRWSEELDDAPHVAAEAEPASA